MRGSKFGLLLCAGMVAACGGGDKAPSESKTTAPTASVSPPAPQVLRDLSTPDRALKSYWTASESLAINDYQRIKEYIADRIKIFGPYLSEQELNTLKQDTGITKLSREIVEVKTESESRAVVIARIKNATPYQAGVTISDYQKKSRENGDLYKYVMERVGSEWKIGEIYSYREWMSPPSWSRYRDSDPYVPTATTP